MLRLLFSPRMVAVHLLAVVATMTAGWLGLWQYDAWQAGREAKATSLAGAEPKPLRSVMSADDPFPGDAVGQPVSFSGRWLQQGGFVVAQRELEGRSGFWVVTPVAVCDGECAPDASAMLVVRGWVPEPQDAPEPPSGRVSITGWLQPPEGSGRPDPDPDDDVLQELRIADALQRVDRDLYGAYVIVDDVTPASRAQALEPVTPDSLPEPETFTSLRNLLYALEWWVFGAFALFVWWRWCTDEVQAAQRPDTRPETAGVASTEQSSSRLLR